MPPGEERLRKLDEINRKMKNRKKMMRMLQLRKKRMKTNPRPRRLRRPRGIGYW